MEASKEGRSLREFRYACVGYSLYADRKNQASGGQPTETELPVCIGLEVSVLDFSIFMRARFGFVAAC